MGGRSPSMRANPHKLPEGWYRDPMFAEDTYAKIAKLLGQGFSHVETAREVGCSDRCVTRYVARMRREPSPLPAHTHRPVPQKLTVEAVRQIRAADKTKHGWGAALAKKFGVHRRTIARVVDGTLWGHVPTDA